MNNRELLDAVLESPDNYNLRRTYANALVTHPETVERGMFILRWIDKQDHTLETFFLNQYDGSMFSSIAKKVGWPNLSNHTSVNAGRVECRGGFIHSVTCNLYVWMKYGQEVVRNHPIRKVYLLDKEPYPLENGYIWSVCDDHPHNAVIPRSIFETISNKSVLIYNTKDKAIEMLSQALILWAKKFIEKPNLTERITLGTIQDMLEGMS